MAEEKTMESLEKAEQLFRDTYQLLADQGGCDRPGGEEYRQGLEKWLAAGRPKPIAPWILATRIQLLGDQLVRNLRGDAEPPEAA